MDSPDQAAEWRRLQDVYSRMNDGELEVVANEAYDLTEIARPLLRDEIARRGLKIPLIMEREKPPEPLAPPIDPSTIDLVPAQTYWDISDARKVKALLNDAGIACFWGPDKLDSPDAMHPDRGFDLMVREVDLPRVQAGLKQLSAGEEAIEVEGDFELVCPQCHSPEIVFQDRDEESGTFHWSCDACGHVWNDDGVERVE